MISRKTVTGGLRKCFAATAPIVILTTRCLAAEPTSGMDEDWGPFFDQFKLTLSPGTRTEIAGPILSLEKQPDEEGWTVSPLMSWRENHRIDTRDFDLLYPILTYHRYGPEYRWQLFQLFSLSGGEKMDGNPVSRQTIFPIFLRQKSPDPERSYTAVMPFYGHVRNRFFRDEVKFVMLPLWVQTRKRDVVTDNYLLPLFHLRKGNNLKGWQFWPVVGAEHKGLTTKTNSFGDTETVGGHDKFFALWPLYHQNKTETGTTNEQSQVIAIPFYARQRGPLKDLTAYGFPFGYMSIHDKEKDYREWGAPWPLIAFARGKGKTMNRIPPFFSEARSANVESDFYMWPIYKVNKIHSVPLHRERHRVLLFLFSRTTTKSTETLRTSVREDFWPLYTRRVEQDGSSRLQVLAPLEPFLPGNKTIERTYSPVWSVWRAESNAKTGASSQSLLWNLYRREAEGPKKKVSLLFGLYRYESSAEGGGCRILGIPLGGHGKRPAKTPATPSAKP